jgi:hypothetical protein
MISIRLHAFKLFKDGLDGQEQGLREGEQRAAQVPSGQSDCPGGQELGPMDSGQSH